MPVLTTSGSVPPKKVYLSQPILRSDVTDYEIRNLNFERPSDNDDYEMHPLYDEYTQYLHEILPVYENVVNF